MIITQYKSKGFKRTLRYVREKSGSSLLGHNLFCSTIEEQNEAMLGGAWQSHRVKKPMIHYAISLAPGERLKDSEWRRLAKQYMREMGYTDNQYLLVRHTDTPHHDHAHLVINRVQRTTGKAVCLGWDYYKSQALVRKLEEQFNLSPVRASWEPFTESLPGDEPLLSVPPEVAHRQAVKEQIRSALNASLIGCENLKDFKPRVEAKGIQVELYEHYGELKGIAFSADNERFTGSQIGNGYSLPKLTRAWETQALQSDPALQEDASFHQRYYKTLTKTVEKRLGDGLSTQQKDFQIAMLAVRSSRPNAAKALVFSPDVQRLKREQGEEVAMDYLRKLMESAQERLRQIDPERKSGRPEKER